MKSLLMAFACLVSFAVIAHENAPTLFKNAVPDGKYVGKTSWFFWDYDCAVVISKEIARDGMEMIVAKLEGDVFEQRYHSENKGLPIQFWTRLDDRVINTTLNHSHWASLANYYSREGQELEGNFMLHLTFMFKHQSDSTIVPDYFSVVVGRASNVTDCSYLKKIE